MTSYEIYQALKQETPDNLLLLKVGDFYEALGEDAKTIAKVCGLVLTSRAITPDQRIPLTAIAYHRLDDHRNALCDAGYPVSIAERVTQQPVSCVVRTVITDNKLIQLDD